MVINRIDSYQGVSDGRGCSNAAAEAFLPLVGSRSFILSLSLMKTESRIFCLSFAAHSVLAGFLALLHII